MSPALHGAYLRTCIRWRSYNDRIWHFPIIVLPNSYPYGVKCREITGDQADKTQHTRYPHRNQRIRTAYVLSSCPGNGKINLFSAHKNSFNCSMVKTIPIVRFEAPNRDRWFVSVGLGKKTNPEWFFQCGLTEIGIETSTAPHYISRGLIWSFGLLMRFAVTYRTSPTLFSARAVKIPTSWPCNLWWQLPIGIATLCTKRSRRSDSRQRLQ